MTVVFLQNRSPMRSLVVLTLYQAWYGTKPAMHFLLVFDCMARVKVTKPNAGKLEDKTMLIGYEEGSKAYMMFDPATNHMHVTRGTVFEKGTTRDWSSSDNNDTREIEPSTNQCEFVVEDD